MANTQGFDIVIQASENVIVKSLKGAWKSATCTIDPGDAGRIPEYVDVTIPAGGINIGGYDIIDGQVQIPQEELNAAFAEDINGAEMILGLKVQLQVGNAPIPSASLLSFHAFLHMKSPISTIAPKLDVGLLLDQVPRTDVWAVLDQGHPLDSRLPELLSDYVHIAYENNEIPHAIIGSDFNLAGISGKADTVIYDDASNPALRIVTSFPNPTTLQISIPVYIKMYGYANFVTLPVIGNIWLDSPMGIDTRIIINVPFEKLPDQYVAELDNVAVADVSVGTITGTVVNSVEAINYANNKATLGILNLDSLLTTELRNRGVAFAYDLGRRQISIPPISMIENVIAGMFYDDLSARGSISLWTPTASNAQFQVNSVDVRVADNALNIALNDNGNSNIGAITRFIPANMDFSIAMSRLSLDAKLQKALADSGFMNLPKRLRQDGKDVDLNSVNITVVDFAIRLSGTVTVIDAIAGSIDVDASFRSDIGLHWEPNAALDANGFQALKHHQIGQANVDPDEGVGFWLIAIILTILSFGAAGIVGGIIAIVVILIVKAIVENLGSEALVNGVNGAVDGITAWPPNLSRIGRVNAVFSDPVEISTSGLVLSGVFNVISSCEDVDIIPAQTAGYYSTRAGQTIQFTALRSGVTAQYIWNVGDGSLPARTKILNHIYDISDIYIAKHQLKVNVPGGALSRHFAMVRVQNVPPVVDAGNDLEINEGQVIILEALFTDVEYSDTHSCLWNFGDGRPLKWGIVEETNNPPHAKGKAFVEYAWCDQGEYIVTVQVIDNNGGVGTDKRRVIVHNVPPVVKTPERIYAYPCSPITLVAKFTDPGWCDIHTGTWQFGDCFMPRMAVVNETNHAPAAKGTITASHVYKKCGRYSAECIVTDDDGGVGTSQTVVEVIELKNHDFNSGFTRQFHGNVANFWNLFIGAPDSIDLKSILQNLPSKDLFFCEKCLVFDGMSSQRITTLNGLTVGVYQLVGANPDWQYQVGALYQLASNAGVFRLGLDPYGLNDPSSPDVVWAEGTLIHQWSHVLQRITAKADAITVFLLAESIAHEPVDCCIDCVELIAMQDEPCPVVSRPTIPIKPTCIDFNAIDRKKRLTSQLTISRVKFTTADNDPHCIVGNLRSGLEMRKGLIIDFPEPVNVLLLEFLYMEDMQVGFVFSDADGNVIQKGIKKFAKGETSIKPSADRVTRAQLYWGHENALTQICFNQSSNKKF